MASVIAFDLLARNWNWPTHCTPGRTRCSIRRTCRAVTGGSSGAGPPSGSHRLRGRRGGRLGGLAARLSGARDPGRGHRRARRRIEELLRVAAVSGFEVAPTPPGYGRSSSQGIGRECRHLAGGRDPRHALPSRSDHDSASFAVGRRGTRLTYIDLPGLVELKLAAGRARRRERRCRVAPRQCGSSRRRSGTSLPRQRALCGAFRRVVGPSPRTNRPLTFAHGSSSRTGMFATWRPSSTSGISSLGE